MDWIYLSPHLDDAALSLGGLLWEQTQTGNSVSIWTICAGDAPPGDFSPFAESLHTRWGTGRQAMQVRRAEDIESCKRLGASYRHFDLPDCIYRRSPKNGEPLYDSEEALWLPVHPDEEPRIGKISQQLQNELPEGGRLVCPMAVGSHVDHRLTRAAAERLGIHLLYYAEFPYVLDAEKDPMLENFQSTVFPISPAGLLAWQEAVAAHQSQISTFWENPQIMRQEIQAYCAQMGGVLLWEHNRT